MCFEQTRTVRTCVSLLKGGRGAGGIGTNVAAGVVRGLLNLQLFPPHFVAVILSAPVR